MTTLVPFTPSNVNTPPWSGQFVLDGQTYNASSWWNVYGQRWYLQLTDRTGTVVWYGPLVGSPMTADIPLAAGVFQVSTILYRTDTNNFEITP